MKTLICAIALFVFTPVYDLNYNLWIKSLPSHGMPNSAGRDQAFEVVGSSIPSECEVLYWNIPSGAKLWGSKFNDSVIITWYQSAIGTTQTLEAICKCDSNPRFTEVSVSQTYTIVP